METPDQIIERAVKDIRRVHEMSVNGAGDTKEADDIRRAIHRGWLSLDPADKKRLQDAQGNFMRETWPMLTDPNRKRHT